MLCFYFFDARFIHRYCRKIFWLFQTSCQFIAINSINNASLLFICYKLCLVLCNFVSSDTVVGRFDTNNSNFINRVCVTASSRALIHFHCYKIDFWHNDPCVMRRRSKNVRWFFRFIPVRFTTLEIRFRAAPSAKTKSACARVQWFLKFDFLENEFTSKEFSSHTIRFIFDWFHHPVHIIILPSVR